MKKRHEQEVAREFLRAVGLPHDAETIRSCEPPEPDVSVDVGGTRIFLELGRLLDKRAAESHVDRINHPNFGYLIPAKNWGIGLPEREVLRAKLGKNYETGSAPVHLILYYDSGRETPVTISEPPPSDFGYFANLVMVPLIHELGSPFHRIWVFHRRLHGVLWAYPVA